MQEKNEEKNKIWFPTKKYGFGWGLPVAWQGWVVLLGYIILLTIGSVKIADKHNPIWIILYVLLFSALFIFICWKKGEKTTWRWGDKK